MMSKAVGTIRVSMNTIRMLLDKIRKLQKRIRKSVDGIRESQRRLSLFLRMISKKGEGLNSLLSYSEGADKAVSPPRPLVLGQVQENPSTQELGQKKGSRNSPTSMTNSRTS